MATIAATPARSGSDAPPATPGRPQQQGSLEALRQRLARAKATRASLQADLDILSPLLEGAAKSSAAAAATAAKPSSASTNPSASTASTARRLAALRASLRSLEERGVVWRAATGVTVFECDLDVGWRERQMRRSRLRRSRPRPTGASDNPSDGQDGDDDDDDDGEVDEEEWRKSEGEALGVGVRLETFWRGRFFEPFYLVFARPSQLLSERAVILRSALDAGGGGRDGDARGGAGADAGDEGGKEALRLVRHTVPAHVPLREMVGELLAPRGATGAAEPRASAVSASDAVASVARLKGIANLDLFLARLHTHLQAYVSRREQAGALGSLALPGDDAVAPTAGVEASSSTPGHRDRLQAFCDAGFLRWSVRWRIPPTAATGAGGGTDEGGEEDGGAEARRRRRERDGEGEEVSALLVELEVRDGGRDRLGARVVVAAATSGADEGAADGAGATTPGTLDGTRFEHGVARVTVVTTDSTAALARKRRRRRDRTRGDAADGGGGEEDEDEDEEGQPRARTRRRRDLEELYAELGAQPTERGGRARGEGEGPVSVRAAGLDEYVAAVVQRVWTERGGRRPRG